MQNTPRLRDLADLYVLRCEVEGKSPKTVSAYRGTLRRFLGAVSVEHAYEVGQEQIYAYLGGCRGLAAESRHRYFREVRCFFSWLVDAGYLEKSPFRGMKNVRLPQRIVQPFSPEEVAWILDACGDGEIGLRDRALITLLLDTGARCSEVIQLTLAEVDVENGRIRILHGKGTSSGWCRSHVSATRRSRRTSRSVGGSRGRCSGRRTGTGRSGPGRPCGCTVFKRYYPEQVLAEAGTQ